MNRLDRGPVVLAILAVIAVALSHFPTWGALTQKERPEAGVSDVSRDFVSRGASNSREYLVTSGG